MGKPSTIRLYGCGIEGGLSRLLKKGLGHSDTESVEPFGCNKSAVARHKYGTQPEASDTRGAILKGI